jgi:ADP-ribose pyrophosphatase
MQVWKTRSKTALLSFGKWMTVESHVVELPDGRVIEDWPWVITPDFASIVAFTPQDQLVCFRQVKYAVEGESFAPPGGYIEPGEDPLEAAKRELLEETGYASGDWSFLGSYAVDANRGVGRGYFFLARNALPAAQRNADDLEEQELLLLEQSEIKGALRAGQFKALPWAAAVAFALCAEPCG